MALTNPTKLINLQELAYFESKLAAKYQTKAISEITGLDADTVEEALAELLGKIDSQISAVYRPAGNIAPEALVSSMLVESNLGKVYNLTADATTTADWVEGAGKTIEAGTDVAVVAVDNAGTTVYKFNAFGIKIDLSGYKTKQTAVADPTASGNATSFIDTISQNANGEITVTKKNVPNASGSGAGLMSADHYTKLEALPTASDLTNELAGKADKDTDAVEGNFAAFDTNGNPVDSGHKHSDYQAAGNYKTQQTAKADPTASGNALSFIATIEQNANGEITATKKSVDVAANSDIDEIFA